MNKLLSLVKNVRRGIGMAIDFAPGLTIGLFVLTIITNLAPLLQSKILGNIVNAMIASIKDAKPIERITFFVLTYAAIYGGIRILNSFSSFLSKLWRSENELGLEMAVLRKRLEIDLGHHESPSFQNLLHRALDRSIWPVYEIIQAQFDNFGNIAVILASSIITSVISWQVYAIVIVSSIPGFIVQLKYGYKSWGIWAEHSERQKHYYHMRSHITGRFGITQTKILQSGERILEYIKDTLVSYQNDIRKTDRNRFFYQTIAIIIGAIGYGFALFLISKNVLAGLISVGSMVFIISALGQLVGSINQFLAQTATLLEKNLYATDIFAVLDTKPFIKRSENPVILNLSGPPTIEFKNVSFKYEGRDDWILRNVNLIINPGEKIALVGMNGAGKSTLIKLLSRIYDPNEGTVLIDGVDLKELDINEWTSYLSVLLQDYISYDLPVKDSIAMSRTEKPTDIDLVKKSAEFSGANEFIEEWEHKYDQQLGKEFEGGIEPSKGQKQKIALAQTIYRNGFIMVLDEPTAAIDALSETKIFEAMEKAVGKNTLIVITHRFNTTQNMDKIIVLEKGTVEEVGNHKELIKHGGIYKKMFEDQAKAFRG